jgi:hypothetical protein
MSCLTQRGSEGRTVRSLQISHVQAFFGDSVRVPENGQKEMRKIPSCGRRVLYATKTIDDAIQPNESTVHNSVLYFTQKRTKNVLVP